MKESIAKKDIDGFQKERNSMKEKLICPDCNKQEVEEVNACGASNYFCNHCKKLISSSRIKEVNSQQETK